MNRKSIFLSVCLLATLSNVLAQSTLDWTKLEQRVNSLLASNGSMGVAMVVVNQDSILFSEGFGLADMENDCQTADSSLFVLGSITKTFTALGILRLVGQGELQLKDPVKELAPELPIDNQWEEDFPLRVYHLLEHTSGFDELHLKDRSIPVEDDHFSLLDGIHIVKNSLRTRWKPGARFAYSNVGYLVAGYLIEKVSGMNYNDFMAQEVLGPLGMTHSSISMEEINQERLAKSYSFSKRALPFKHIFTRPTGSLISSAEDMGQFLICLLRQDTLLNELGFQEFETHHSIQAFRGTVNGYKLGVYSRFHGGHQWFGHGGSINKYNSEFEYNRALGLGVFVVSNGPNATRTVDDALKAFHELIPENQIQETSVTTVPKADLSAFDGYYVLTSPRNQLLYPFTELFSSGLFIESAQARLLVSSFGGDPFHLTQTGNRSFSPSGKINDYQYVFNTSDILHTSLGFTYKRVSFFLIATLALTLITCFSLTAVSPFLLLVRVVRFARNKVMVFSPQLILEIGSSVLLAGCVLFLFMGTFDEIHKPQFMTVLLFLCSIFFPMITVFGMAHTLRYRFPSRLSKFWAFGLGIAMMILNSYLIYWGFFGFRVWQY